MNSRNTQPTIDEILATKNLTLLTQTLKQYYADYSLPQAVMCLRDIQAMNSDESKAELIKTYLDASLSWNSGWFSFKSIFGLFASGVGKDTEPDTLFMRNLLTNLLTTYINNNQISVDTLCGQNNTLMQFIDIKDKAFFGFLLQKMNQKSFENICEFALMRKDIKFAQLIKETADLNSHAIPNNINDLAQGKCQTEEKKPAIIPPPVAFTALPLNDPNYESQLEQYVTKTWEFGPFKKFDTQSWGREQTQNDAIMIEDLVKRYENQALNVNKINNKKLLFGVCLANGLNQLALVFAECARLTGDELGYYAIRQKNHEFLRLIFERGIKLNPKAKEPGYSYSYSDCNWLLLATLANIECLRLLFNHFDSKTLTSLVNTHYRESSLAAAVRVPTQDLVETLNLFIKFANADFNKKNNDGIYPAQAYHKNQTDEARRKIFSDLNIINYAAISASIGLVDINMLKLNLQYDDKNAFKFVFMPENDEHKVNEPSIVKGEIWQQGYHWSPRISYFEYAVYCGELDIVKLLMSEVLLRMPEISIEDRVKILTDTLSYLQETMAKAVISLASDKESSALDKESSTLDKESSTLDKEVRIEKLGLVEDYLTKTIAGEKFKLPAHSSFRLYQPKPVDIEKLNRKVPSDPNDWNAPVYR